MKPTNLILLALLIATPALRAEITQTPLPLPEFKTAEQLVKWRAETTAKSVAAEQAQASASAKTYTTTGFYTGKPYLAESGTYSFLYRDYNPEQARWTTVDLSGFPDGANALTYCKNSPVAGFDWQGLNYTVIGSVSGVTFFGSYSYGYTSQASTSGGVSGGTSGINGNGSVSYSWNQNGGSTVTETTTSLPSPSAPSGIVISGPTWIGSPSNTTVTSATTTTGSPLPGPGLTQQQSWTVTTITTQSYSYVME